MKTNQLYKYSVRSRQKEARCAVDSCLKIATDMDGEDGKWNRIGKLALKKKVLRRNPIEDGAISGFSGQKSVPE